MKIVSVINYKGGVGKTTITANLGAEMARRGKRVLLIDLDAQASLTFSFIKPDAWKQQLAGSKTIKNWFDSFADNAITPLTDLVYPIALPQHLQVGRLDLIPSHLGLINVDLELAMELMGASLEPIKKNFLRVHSRLADGVRTIPRDAYDLVLIDCPPSFNVVTKTAIVACQHILIPAKPDYLSTLGIDYLIGNVHRLVRHYNQCVPADSGSQPELIDPRFLGVVFTMVQEYSGKPISAARQFMAEVERLGIPVFKAYVKENKTLFAEAPLHGTPVVLGSPQAPAHRQVIDEIKELVNECQSKLGLDSEVRNGRRGKGIDRKDSGSVGRVVQTA